MNLHGPPLPRPATFQDVLDAPEHMVAEIIPGVLHLQLRPDMRHGRAGSMLAVGVGGPSDRGRGGPGGWWIVFVPEQHLGDEVLVLDLAGRRCERMPRLPRTASVTQLRHWLCGVLQPGARAVDLGPKRDIYNEQGVGHLWLVDTDARTPDVFARKAGALVRPGVLPFEAEVRKAPFEAVGFSLG